MSRRPRRRPRRRLRWSAPALAGLAVCQLVFAVSGEIEFWDVWWGPALSLLAAAGLGAATDWGPLERGGPWLMGMTFAVAQLAYMLAATLLGGGFPLLAVFGVVGAAGYGAVYALLAAGAGRLLRGRRAPTG